MERGLPRHEVLFSAMQSQLVDFLNHGLLPFTGRADVIERIFEFWRGNAHAHGLRTLVVTGEAGIGKSRALEEVIPRITREGGGVVHAKLYPESNASVSSSIARALRQTYMRRAMTGAEPDGTFPSVMAALRRVVQLHPTLLVIEDIHLLGETSLGQLSILLDTIKDEPVSLLALARPLSPEIHNALKESLVEEITLTGLSDENISHVIGHLFGTRLDDRAIRHIGASTLGNPLALRSALRGIIKAGAIVRDSSSGIWRAAIPDKQFKETLRRSVELLSEGMTAHLTDAEQETAWNLAALGEVFSRHAAEVLAGENAPLIDSLMFKGILVVSGAGAAPLKPTDRPDIPLAFTHTLLHRRCVEQTKVDPDALVRIIIEGTPVYSLLPFQLLAERVERLTVGTSEIHQLIDRMLQTAHWINDTAGWPNSQPLWLRASTIFERYNGTWEEEERLDIERTLMKYRISLQWRKDHTPEFRKMSEQYLALTENPRTEAEANHRFVALVYLLINSFRGSDLMDMEIRRSIDQLAEQFPGIIFTREYVFYLEQLARYSTAIIDRRMLTSVEQHLNLVLAHEGLDDEFRHTARSRLYPYLVMNFDTREQMEKRLAWVNGFAEMRRYSDSMGAPHEMVIKSIAFLANTCMFDRLVETLDNDVIPRFERHGYNPGKVMNKANRLIAFSGFGMPPEQYDAGMRALAAQLEASDATRYRDLLAMYLFEINYICGAPELGYKALQDLLVSRARMPLILWTFEALVVGDLTPLPPHFSYKDESSAALSELIAAVMEKRDIGPAVERFGAIEVLRIDNLMDLIAVARLTLLACNGAAAVPEEIRKTLGGKGVEALEWLLERRLPSYMKGMLGYFSGFMSKSDVLLWSERIARIEVERRKDWDQSEERSEPKISLTTIGTIAVTMEDGSTTPIRGPRLRALMGMLVAAVLDEPVGYDEFSAVISGIEDDPDKARKSLNSAVYRLRELLGHDIVLTDGEIPALNTSIVRVDLLEARDAMIAAHEALSADVPEVAYRQVVRALDLLGGEIPFPSLYDHFFEAVRERVENRIRNLIVRVSGTLLAADLAASAEDLLARGFRAMPEDEEIALLLRNTLIRLGKRTEAERIRMLAEEATVD